MATVRERSEWIGPRVTVLQVLVVGVLSVLTGVVNIGTAGGTIPVLTALVEQYLSAELKQVAAFSGTLTGFVLIGLALALRRGYRIAWYGTLVALPVTAAQGIVQTNPLSIPLIVLSLVALPVVFLNRRRFDREVNLTTTQLAAGSALVGVQVYGTVGAFALEEHFGEAIETPLDAFWYTLVTASTVGYGDITPQTQVGKWFGSSVLVLGTASFAIALGALLGPAIEARFARALGRMTESQLELLQNHVLVLGYGELTEPILGELRDGDVEFVVITPDTAKATELADRGFQVITADPSSEEPLQRAQIEDARAIVVATNNDAEDALSVLTARQLRPDVRIVVAATDRENVNKLRRAGADTVISPASIGGHLLVQSALGADDTEEVADKILDDEAEPEPEPASEAPDEE